MSDHQRTNGPLGSKSNTGSSTNGIHQHLNLDRSSVNQHSQYHTRNANITESQPRYQVRDSNAIKSLLSSVPQDPEQQLGSDLQSQGSGSRSRMTRLERPPPSSDASRTNGASYEVNSTRRRLNRKPPTSSSIYSRSSDVTTSNVEQNSSGSRSDIANLDNGIEQIVLADESHRKGPLLNYAQTLEYNTAQEISPRIAYLRGNQEPMSFDVSDRGYLPPTSKDISTSTSTSSGTSFKSHTSDNQAQRENIEEQQNFDSGVPFTNFYASYHRIDSSDNHPLGSKLTVDSDASISGRNMKTGSSFHRETSGSLEDLAIEDAFLRQSRNTRHDNSGVSFSHATERRNEFNSLGQSVVAGHDKFSPISRSQSAASKNHASYSSSDFSYPHESNTVFSGEQTSEPASQTASGLFEEGTSQTYIPKKSSIFSESSRSVLQDNKHEGIHKRMSSVTSVNSAGSNHHVSLATLKMALVLRPGEGEKSYYVDTMRKNSGTSFNEAGPGKWKLPTGILPVDKREYMYQSNRKFTRGAHGSGHKTKKASGVELKHGHLQPRLLAAEVDDGEMTNKYGALGRSSTLQNKPLTPATSKSSSPPTGIDGVSRTNSLERGNTRSSMSTTGDVQSSLSKVSRSRRGSDSSLADSIGSIKGEQRVDIYYQHQGFKLENNDDSSDCEDSTNRFEENSYDDSEDEKPRLFLANPDSDSS